MGAGDGGYVVHRARGEPATFAIAIDANPDGLSDGAWRARRARLGNVAFLVTSVERMPREFVGLADEIAVHFPWGSLLGGLLRADPAVLEPLARTLRHGGELTVFLSATARDGLADVAADDLVALAPAYERWGLILYEARPVTAADVAGSHSSWAKRLGIPRLRSGVVARYRRAGRD